MHLAHDDRDGQLVEVLRRREDGAAERLISMFADRAYRLATAITGNQQDAEEAVQDAFWNAIRHIDTFRGDAALGSWIYRITANAAYQRRRSARHRCGEISLDEILPSFHADGRHADPIVDWSTEFDDPAAQTELRSVLTAALEELPDHYRAVIILHDVEGLSMAKVADCLDITVPTAKSRAHRARLFLRHRLAGSCRAQRLASRWARSGKRDLGILLRQYADAGNVDRLYGTELAVLEIVNPDGPRLLGRDVARMTPTETRVRILGLLDDVVWLDRLVRDSQSNVRD